MLTRLFKRKVDSAAASGNTEAARREADRLIEKGQPLEDRGHVEAALRLYRAATQIAPDYARGYMNIGHALDVAKRWDEAESAHRKAVECAPDHAPARFNLGLSLVTPGHFDEAEQELLLASRLQPDLVEAPIALADLYETLDRLDEAEAQYVATIRMAPDHAGALLNYGMFCLARGRLDEGSRLITKARSIAPALSDAESAVLFALNFRTDVDAGSIASQHRAVGKLISRNAGAPFTTWPNMPLPDRQLRVGYVSGDFLVHPVALFLQALLPNHRPENVTTFCYSNYAHSNPTADSLRAKCQHWCDVHDMGDEQFADRIRQDQIDVLVDLSGHTKRNRLQVFARHPAPVQMTWLGYLNTTGLEAMDYRICDHHTDPAGVEHLYTEKLLRMPDSQWCYQPWCATDPVARPHPNEPDVIVFGSFNQVAKISDGWVDVWARILAALPSARLQVADVRQPRTAKRLLERFSSHGIHGDRVVLRDREPLEQYYSSVGHCDIGLDTYPYNGATTTLDVLWMGVPVVGLRGDRSISRSTYSILRTVGADDLIAESIDEYVNINVRLATDAAWRARLRSCLRERLQASALMDGSGFAMALEQRYRDAWKA